MPAEVRVATLNLFNNDHGRWSEREALVHEQAAALDADVLTLQECDVHGDQLPRLVDALGEGYRAIVGHNPTPGSRKSLAVVTRLEAAGDVCVGLGSGDIALRAQLRLPDSGELEVATTHLHFGPSRGASEIRAEQVRRLLAWLGPIPPTRPLVLTGDFNATAAGDTIKSLKRPLRSAHEEVHGDEPEWTHPTPLLQIVDTKAAFGVPLLPEAHGHAIDYLFTSPAFTVVDCRIAFDRPADDEPRLFPSDHLGLVATLRLP